MPGDSTAKVKWTQDEAGLSVLAELQGGTEHIRAELHRNRTKNETVALVVMLWQRLKLLQGLIPNSFQVYFTLCRKIYIFLNKNLLPSVTLEYYTH